MSKRATERQQAILETVERLAVTHGRPVSPQEVADATEIPLTTVRYHAKLLAGAGKIRRHFGGRALEVVKA
jgi:DeoR/GlpR family transcriptional regulator of sugar metabolism